MNDPVCQKALAGMLEQLKPERALVLVEGQGGGRLTVAAAHGVDPDSVFDTAPISLTLIEKVRRSGQPLLSMDAVKDPALSEHTSLVVAGTRSVVCVPIWAGRRVCGLLYADELTERRVYSYNDVVRLTNLAGAVGRSLVQAPQPRPAPAPARPIPPGTLRLESRARALLLRSLSALVGAGVTLHRTFTLLSCEGEDPASRELCRRVESMVYEGNSLNEAFRRSGGLTEFQLQLLQVAEHSGALIEVLQLLAADEEKTRALVMKVRASLTYPVALFVVCTVLLLGVPPFLVRGPLQALAGGAQAPLLTRVVMGGVNFLASPAGVLSLVGLAVLAWVLATLVTRRPAWRGWLYRRALGLPALGRLLRLATTAHFARSLALQLRVGVSILQAVPSSAATTSNPVLLGGMPEVLRALREGTELSDSLSGLEVFSTGFLSLVRAGEESGRLPDTLVWVARLAELDLEASLEAACAALEPLITMGMGVVAAIVALATLLPMVRLVQEL